MKRYYITDRKSAGGMDRLLFFINRAVCDGVDMVCLREKDLNARELTTLVQRAVAMAAQSTTRIFVNTRIDIAIACGADGVHLPADSLSPRRVLDVAPPGFLVAVSCHCVLDLHRAESESAHFAVFGPVFATPGKGEPVGLEALREACSSVTIPVFALGGIDPVNAHDCIRAGAAGIAGIRLFQS